MIDRPFAQVLRHIAIDRGRRIATRFQFFSQFNGRCFGADENNHAVERFHLQNPGQRIQFMHAADHPITLANVFGRGGGDFYGDLLRLNQIILGYFADD